jgi:hypothetical protein
MPRCAHRGKRGADGKTRRQDTLSLLDRTRWRDLRPFYLGKPTPLKLSSSAL